jgi:cellulose biosynthesis protein BcsQ
MKRISLVIADDDQDFVNCLAEYLMLYHGDKFEVTTFTEEASLRRYWQEEVLPEIILAGPVFASACKEMAAEKKALVIALTCEIKDEKNDENARSKKELYKYQCGERIVAALLELFAAEAAAEYAFTPQPRKTKTIGVFSPVGGAGKTTLAVGASMQTAWEGKSCFYLNLENMTSVPLYFFGEQRENLSGILYYLKNNRKNLSIHLEKAKCIDPLTKIAYYQPPDNVIDFKEDIATELRLLLRELSGSGQYDRIFVDLSTEVNRNNLAVLQACDRIILVAEPKMTSLVKLQQLFRELDLLSSREGWDIRDKFVFVLNKVAKGLPEDPERQYVQEAWSGLSKGTFFKIPLVQGLALLQNGGYRLDLNSEFGKALYSLLQACED